MSRTYRHTNTKQGEPNNHRKAKHSRIRHEYHRVKVDANDPDRDEYYN